MSAARQTGSSFIYELTYECNGTNLRVGDLSVESVPQAEDLGWLSEGVEMELESMTETYVLYLE